MAHRLLARASVGFLFLVAAGVAEEARAQNWDGSGQLRFGAFVQGSFSDWNVSQTPANAPAFRQSIAPDGIGAGVVAGYDLRLGTIVLGAEADVGFTSGSTKHAPGDASQYNVDYVATLRARLGLLVHPSVLIYGTAGIAMLGAEFKFIGPGVVTSSTGVLDQKKANMAGLSVGGGVEYDAGWGVLFGEYLFNDYGSWTFQNFDGTRVAIHPPQTAQARFPVRSRLDAASVG